MLQNCDKFERPLLEVVLNDLVPFNSITAKLWKQHTASGGTFDVDELQCLLLLLVADDLVGVYLVHADSPFVTAVEANSDTVQRYWFRITSRGKRRLQNLREKHSRIYLERSA
jgi:hypothetical protein